MSIFDIRVRLLLKQLHNHTWLQGPCLSLPVPVTCSSGLGSSLYQDEQHPDPRLSATEPSSSPQSDASPMRCHINARIQMFCQEVKKD